MSERNQELADFLRRARSQVDHTRTGLPVDERVRRVPGLRREEVAQLARVSSDYYTRLEQGRPITPSAGIIDAIARALDLDDAGLTHLRHLIGGTDTIAQQRRTPRVQRPRHGLLQLMEALDSVPAMLLGRRTDVLATNQLARALLTDFDAMPAKGRNYARWMSLAPEARDLFTDWEMQARVVVENLRLEAGRNSHDPATQALVGELTIASSEFAAWWQEHRVFQRTHGDKRFHHPIVGDLTLQYETVTLPGDPDQTLFLYTAEAGTKHRDALNLLNSWAAIVHVHDSPGPSAKPSGRIDDVTNETGRETRPAAGPIANDKYS
ncbi:helix-turn-helix transcriptional regulator [Curtobacterium sp. MCPF17_002]|uniref:helix-turn-helix transcriptional regulator n=1 Tax=Curtobacterium sp. MCPF17_002 TaxID=2175645 RepID=UPI0024DF77F8|nr:helix-turn-helix transcriptional regulator [Curtobacterium sp. MCPF17_002]WIB77968.1 helix-turn-helix transcriptional regulator [Curtobacterium sp. MCPF17_002]